MNTLAIRKAIFPSHSRANKMYDCTALKFYFFKLFLIHYIYTTLVMDRLKGFKLRHHWEDPMRPPCIISRECTSVEPPAFRKPAGRIQAPERGSIQHR